MKYIFTISVISCLVVLAGCQSDKLSTNTGITETLNTNEVEDTSDLALSEVEGWLTYENEEYGFSFRYPSDWNLKEVIEGGLGTKPGDVLLSKKICQIHVDKPAQAPDDIIEALATKKLRGSIVEVLNINGLNVIKQVGPVNTYGGIGDSYRILNDSFEVSLFVMQSGIDVESCVADYQEMIQTIMKL